ncbi:MAG: DUF3560 domain-containing protein [Solirubrobacterales bacterium]
MNAADRFTPDSKLTSLGKDALPIPHAAQATPEPMKTKTTTPAKPPRRSAQASSLAPSRPTAEPTPPELASPVSLAAQSTPRTAAADAKTLRAAGAAVDTVNPKPQTIPEPMSPAKFSSTGSATYCPEDNKLRLYVGRVPRPEYEALRAEGWTSTPKQTCDFVATWTPARRDTALIAGEGIIDDEDASPAERAADRAERFGDYRDKRTEEATGHADRYDAGPSAHGYQSQARAERSAARHDRIATHATDAWSKAEYWTRRTAGVISHALYKSRPDVRMGRIKTLEAELRKEQENVRERQHRWRVMNELKALVETPDADTAETTAKVLEIVGCLNLWCDYRHPRAETNPNQYRRENDLSLYSLMTDDADPITGAEALALWFSDHREPATENEWTRHLELRLAYENQMLEAQGGRAGVVEMVPGGWIRGGRHYHGDERQIQKVNKSPTSGRVVSVLVRDNYPSAVNHYGNPYPDGVRKVLSHQIEVERMDPAAYRPPTEDELAKFHAGKAAAKAAAPKKPECPLINPTDADADRLQSLWNGLALARWLEADPHYHKAEQFKGSTVLRMTQERYSAISKGSYAKGETRQVRRTGALVSRTAHYYKGDAEEKRAAALGAPLCSLRCCYGDGNTTNSARRIIILTDKPQKPIPAAVFDSPTAPKPEPAVEFEPSPLLATIAAPEPAAVATFQPSLL